MDVVFGLGVHEYCNSLDNTPCTKMIEETAQSEDDRASFTASYSTFPIHDSHGAEISSDCEENIVSLIPHILLTHADVLHFSLYFVNAQCCWQRGNHNEIVFGRPAEEKQLVHTSKTAAHKTLSAPESPFSLCNVMDQEKEKKYWNCSFDQNLNSAVCSMWETFFCVHFQSSYGRLKTLQSFWNTLYVCCRPVL
jgi:hypothetical protein